MRRLVSAPSGLALGLLAWALAIQGCGPSFEAIQEGDLRFAHCDRLDLDTHIAPSHRLHCWREWRRVYTYGQTRDRVDYAQRRIAEVVSGDPDPPFELPSGQAQRSDAVAPGAPNPVHSSPPATVAMPNTEAVAPDTEGSAAGCRSQCESSHVGCAPGCETQPTGCKNCESSLEACLSNCTAKAP